MKPAPLPCLPRGTRLPPPERHLGLKKLDYDRLMTVSISRRSVFCRFAHPCAPSGITSAHLILNGLLGVMLGWAAFPAILAALALRAAVPVWRPCGAWRQYLYHGLFGVAAGYVFSRFVQAVAHTHWAKDRRLLRRCAGRYGRWPAYGCGGGLQRRRGFATAARLLFLAHLPSCWQKALSPCSPWALSRVRPEMLRLSAS